MSKCCTKDELKALYIARAAKMLAKGYQRIWTNDDGRLCVEADVSKINTDAHHNFRAVWGPEWPIVRSSKPNMALPAEEQLVFRSCDPPCRLL